MTGARGDAPGAADARADAVSVRLVHDAAGIEALVPLLLLAEPSERALRWSLAHLSDAVYRLDAGDPAAGPAGAATIRPRPAADSGRWSASASRTVCARQTNIPEFHTYLPEAR